MNSTNTVINMWDRISVYCMNHDIPKPMEIIKNSELIKTPFYACKNYVKDAADAGAESCFNRLNLDDYQGVVMKFLDIVGNGEIATNYTNCTFSYKGTRHKISVKVLKYDDEEIRLGILNQTVLGRK